MRQPLNTLNTDLYSTIIDNLANELLPKVLPVFSNTTTVFEDFIKRLPSINKKELNIEHLYTALAKTFLSKETVVQEACNNLIVAYLNNRTLVSSVVIEKSITLGNFLSLTFDMNDEHLKTKIASMVIFFLSTYTKTLVH